MNGAAYGRIVEALRGRGMRVVESAGGRAEAQCPHHEDQNPSLSVTGISERTLIWCHAGCSTGDVLAALGLTMADLYDERSATYEYDDGRTVQRYYDRRGKKRFSQRNAGPTAVLYHVARLAEIPNDAMVFVVEGEADVHAVEAAGGVATTAPQGAGSFGKVDVSPLAGRQITVVVDADAAGEKWAAQVASSLAGVADRYQFVRAAAGKDASDHIAAGYRLDQFVPRERTETEHNDIIEGWDQASQLLDGGSVTRQRRETIAVSHSDDAPAEEPELAPLPDIRLPAEVWESRPFFKHVRAAALATRTNPDAVLGAALAMVASMVPPGIKFDSGADAGEAMGSTNLFTALIAPSGIGKSRSQNAAEKLIIPPANLCDEFGHPNFDRYRFAMGIGSGEGLIEAFMGVEKRDVVGKNGKPTEETYRTQTRGNVFFSVDEGETFNKLVVRTGATLGPILRSAWNGGSLGQSNASAETTRHLAGGGYSLGLLIAYQPGTAAELLRDAGPGTPQRFLWFGTRNGQIVRERFPWPGRIELPQWPASGTIRFDHIIEAELLDYDVDKHLGLVVVKELDSHEPLLWCKVAALLALIEGRPMVDLDDWDLAKTIVSTSASIRDRLVDQLSARKELEEQERREAKVGDAMAVRAEDTWVKKKALEICDEARAKGVVRWPDIYRACNSKRRERLTQARDLAIANGEIVIIGDEIRPRIGS